MSRKETRYLGFMPIPALVVFIAALHLVVKPSLFYEPSWLLPIANTVFITVVFFIVAYISMRNYNTTGRIQILLLGSGVLGFGIGGVIAGFVRSVPGTGANLNVTIYNTGALIGATFHFAAALILMAGISPEVGSKRKGFWLVSSYVGLTVYMALFTVASIGGIIPPFFIQGVGPTALRQWVLGSADILFAFSFLILMGLYLRNGEVFLYWYSLALALTSISLTAFFIESAVGSPIGWAGRFSQYLGGIYFLIAVITAIRNAQVRRISLDDVLTTSLSPAEEKFRALAEHSPDMIERFDRGMKYIYANPARLRLFGKPGSSIIGTALDAAGTPGSYVDLFKENLQKVFESAQPVEVEHYLSTENGTRFFQSRYVPEFGVDGAVVNVLVLSRDLTERKRMEEALRRAYHELEVRVQERTAELARANQELREEIDRRLKTEEQLIQAKKMEAVGTLAGGIAHDFNNILLGIIANAELSLKEIPESAPVRDRLERILKAGLRGRDLTRRTLVFSGKSVSAPKIVSLSTILNETFGFLRGALPSTINMQLHLGVSGDRILADASQIQQVIINLGTNAAYAMREGEEKLIEIGLEEISFRPDDLPEPDMAPGDYLVVSVKDSGIGMVESVQRRIFEPFFTTKPVQEGTGLGLFVVYSIVKNHKGAISVSSEPGKGSLFRIFFPRVDETIAEEKVSPAMIPKGNENVLLVDDEEIIACSIRNLLEHLGYKVMALTDSREALDCFRQAPSQFDIAVIDQTMPRMTGDVLAREMMQIRRDIPIILCSGYNHGISLEQVKEMGIQHFLAKPSTMREMAEAVRIALDRSKNKP